MTDDPIEDHTAGSALAGGAIAIGLFQVLIEKQIISREEALNILGEAQGFLENSQSAIKSAAIVGSLYERILKGR